MNKQNLSLLLLFLLLGSCRSLRVRDFHTNENLPHRLPPLGLLIHDRSFLASFDHAFARDVVIGNVAAGPYAPAPWVAYDVTDQALQDVFHVLGNELQNNLSQSVAPQFGHARFKLLFYKRRNAGWGWTVASVSTLFVPNVLGMPIRTHRVEVELQMEIVDAEGRILARYAAPGVGKAQVAAYHGYNSPTATRKANLLALQSAMSRIKSKLASDAPSLTNQLETTGPLRKRDGK